MSIRNLLTPNNKTWLQIQAGDMTVHGLPPNKMLSSNSAGDMRDADVNSTNLTFTANELNTVQDIDPTADPTFNSITSGSVTVGTVEADTVKTDIIDEKTPSANITAQKKVIASQGVEDSTLTADKLLATDSSKQHVSADIDATNLSFTANTLAVKSDVTFNSVDTNEIELQTGAVGVNKISVDLTTDNDDKSIPTTKAVNDAISQEDLWDRSGTTLLAKNSGDSLGIDIINEETGSGNGTTIEGTKFKNNEIIFNGTNSKITNAGDNINLEANLNGIVQINPNLTSSQARITLRRSAGVGSCDIIYIDGGSVIWDNGLDPTNDFVFSTVAGGESLKLVRVGGKIKLKNGESVNNISNTLEPNDNDSIPTTAAVQQVFTDAMDPNGFINTTDQTSSFVDGTRTFTIQPTGPNFSFYSDSLKYTKSVAENVVISDSEGIHIIYYDGATLTAQYNPSSTQIDTIFVDKAIVAWIYWDATNNEAILFTGDNEYHGCNMSGKTHAYLHTTLGAQYVSGAALNTFSVDGSGAVVDAQFGVDSGVLRDEDLTVSLSSVASTTGCPVYYRSGSDWRRTINAGYSAIATGSGRIAYDNNGVLTEVGNNDYSLMHIFGINDATYQYIAIMGQAEYGTVGQARNGAADEINNLVLAGLPFPEMIPVGSVIYQANDGYVNAIKARIRSDGQGNDYVDFRTSGISPSIAPTSHSSLTSLSNDDHSQYALLAGRGGDVLLMDDIRGFAGSTVDVALNQHQEGQLSLNYQNNATNSFLYQNRLNNTGEALTIYTTNLASDWSAGTLTTSNDYSIFNNGLGVAALTLGDSNNYATFASNVRTDTLQGRTVTDNQIELQNSGRVRIRPGNGAETQAYGNLTNGDALFAINKVAAADLAQLRFKYGSTLQWLLQTKASDDTLYLTNNNTSNDIFSVNYTTDQMVHSTDVRYNAGVSINGDNSGSADLEVYSTDGVPVDIYRTASSTNTVLRCLELFRRTTGTPAAGIGCSIAFRPDDSGGNPESAVVLSGILNDVTPTAEHATFRVELASDSSLFTAMDMVAGTGNSLTTTIQGDMVLPDVYNNTVTSSRDLEIQSDGTIGYVASVLEAKKNIYNISDPSWLFNLKPVKFNYRKKKDGKYTDECEKEVYYGLIAQDVEKVNKELVFYDAKGKLAGVNYKKIICPLLKLVQDQQKKIKELEDKVAKLTTYKPGTTDMKSISQQVSLNMQQLGLIYQKLSALEKK